MPSMSPNSTDTLNKYKWWFTICPKRILTYTYSTRSSVVRFGARRSQLFLQILRSFAIVLQNTPNLLQSGSRTEFVQSKESAHRFGGLHSLLRALNSNIDLQEFFRYFVSFLGEFELFLWFSGKSDLDSWLVLLFWYCLLFGWNFLSRNLTYIH